MRLQRLDHLVLTVSDVTATVDFYSRILGMTHEVFGEGRHALKFGNQKLNLHAAAAPIQPHALNPQSGSADLCFLTTTPLTEIMDDLARLGVVVGMGPVDRTGATGPIRSIYLRDPDGNLLEIANSSD